MKTIFLILLLCLFSIAFSRAQHGETPLRIDIPEGATPWTSLDLNNEEEQFQFAIVTDRTGGHRPGVFMDGVNKLNLLQPEFVMSVGDLIEGYTTDLDELNRQWDEFDGFVRQLEMPFFYVPGNHDLTNEVMLDLWKKRLGPTHYSFVYKQVLFLCLNSEDQLRGSGRGSISDEQLEWIKKTLARHQELRWTLVFMHQPLWVQETDPLRWGEVEELLRDRPHTVFVGHRHHYVKFERNSGKYFQLATTGGGSPLRGPGLGEFDHVVWVTMTKKGPVLANLQLEGIWDENVSTERTRDFAMQMTGHPPVRIEPLYVAGNKFKGGQVKIRITNDHDFPMTVKLTPGFSWDLLADLSADKLEIAPNSVGFADLLLQPRKDKSPEEMDPARISAKVLFATDEFANIEIPLSLNIAPEPDYRLKERSKAVAVDGQLDEWKTFPYRINSEDTHDLSAAFDLAYDQEFFYFGGSVTDDDLQVDTAMAARQQDFIGIVLNGEPLAVSAMRSGAYSYENSVFVTLSPQTADRPDAGYDDENLPENTRWKCVAAGDGYQFEVAIPLSYIKEKQGDNWKQVRINVMVQDKDADKENRPRYYFKPNWQSNENRVGSGMFFR